MPRIPKLPDLLAKLVACPSVNPGKSPSSESGEKQMVMLLKEILEPWADHIDIIEVKPGRPNLVARFNGKTSSPSYAMEAHTDTVSVDGMSISPFLPSIKENRLYGRGACDTKGPMAAMMLALIQAKQSTGTLPATWYFIATCDEELGGLGARKLMKQGFRCDGIIVGEPTELKIIDSHKGACRYDLTLSGRSGHSAYPENGINVIHAAGEFITALVKQNERFREEFQNNPLGPPTFSAGIIRGGDQVNRIPDSLELSIDCRILPNQREPEIRKLLGEILVKTGISYPGIGDHLENTQSYPGLSPDPDPDLLFRRIVDSLAEATGLGFDSARYTTNAGFYSSANIPAVVFGPGSIAQAHTAEEWIDLIEVEKASGILVNIITQCELS